MFHRVSKVVLCDRHNTFARFSEEDSPFSCQAQHFGDLHVYFAWHAQHFRHVVLRVFLRIALSGLRQVVTACISQSYFAWQAQHLVKIRCVWNAILGGRCSIWDTFLFAIAASRIGTAARGAMLPSSFVPFCLAGKVLGDVVACHPRLGPHSIHSIRFPLYTLHSTPLHTLHITFPTQHSTVSALLFALDTLPSTPFLTPQSTLIR